MGEDRELMLGQLAAIYIWPACASENQPPPYVRITHLWRVLTGDDECNTQHMTTNYLHYIFPNFPTCRDFWTLHSLGVLTTTPIKNRRFSDGQ